MSDRRSRPRFVLSVWWDGVLETARDVIVGRVTEKELIGFSQVPACRGEEMSLGLHGGGECLQLQVRVLESRPLVLEGLPGHRLRLSVLAPERGPVVASVEPR
jgi:hypothetical protein